MPFVTDDSKQSDDSYHKYLQKNPEYHSLSEETHEILKKIIAL